MERDLRDVMADNVMRPRAVDRRAGAVVGLRSPGRPDSPASPDGAAHVAGRGQGRGRRGAGGRVVVRAAGRRRAGAGRDPDAGRLDAGAVADRDTDPGADVIRSPGSRRRRPMPPGCSSGRPRDGCWRSTSSLDPVRRASRSASWPTPSSSPPGGRPVPGGRPAGRPACRCCVGTPGRHGRRPGRGRTRDVRGGRGACRPRPGQRRGDAHGVGLEGGGWYGHYYLGQAAHGAELWWRRRARTPTRRTSSGSLTAAHPSSSVRWVRVAARPDATVARVERAP